MRSILVAFVLCAILVQAFATSSTEKNDKPAAAKKPTTLELSNNRTLSQKSFLSTIFSIIQQIIQVFLQISGAGRNLGVPTYEEHEIQPAPIIYKRASYKPLFH